VLCDVRGKQVRACLLTDGRKQAVDSQKLRCPGGHCRPWERIFWLANDSKVPRHLSTFESGSWSRGQTWL